MSEAINKQSQQERQVGVELEFGGVTLEKIAELVQGSVGGRIEKESPYAAVIHETSIGKVKVELDAVLFSEFKLRGMLKGLPFTKGKRDVAHKVEAALATEARRWVPFELVFPPLPFNRIGELESVREALADDAEGTDTSIYNAFGLHFNPELPEVNAPTVLRYLRSFLVLYDSLKKWHKVDPTRRIVPFIDPFPKDYKKLVLRPDYAPDEQQLIEDYLDHNATRNRPLDLLPLFAHINEELVRQRLPEEKINARPTLHYRLPNCRIDDPQWTIGKEWKVYLKLEELAEDEEALTSAVQASYYQLTHPLKSLLRRWWNAIREFLHVS